MANLLVGTASWTDKTLLASCWYPSSANSAEKRLAYYARQYSLVEVDATCTLVLRRDGVDLRGEALGTPSAATTDCGEVRVGGDALTSGTWEAVLTYTSETSVGESAAVEVEVP